MPTQASEPVSLNDEQDLYVIPCSDGYTGWGYDNALSETKALARRLHKRVPADSERGTLALYDYHRELIGEFSHTGRDLGTWFHAETKPAVRKALERARREHLTIRLWTGDADTGLAWLEECDVLGHVGRSMGPLKVPLLIRGRNAGGSAILDHCVVRLVDVRTGEELYRHRKFHLPELRIVDRRPGNEGAEYQRYPFAVTAGDDETVTACFEAYDKAAHYVAFMYGHSFVPTVDDRDED